MHSHIFYFNSPSSQFLFFLKQRIGAWLRVIHYLYHHDQTAVLARSKSLAQISDSINMGMNISMNFSGGSDSCHSDRSSSCVLRCCSIESWSNCKLCQKEKYQILEKYQNTLEEDFKVSAEECFSLQLKECEPPIVKLCSYINPHSQGPTSNNNRHTFFLLYRRKNSILVFFLKFQTVASI